MSTSRIANRYAKALMELAVEEGSLERVLSDMKLIGTLAKEDRFKAFISSPIIDKKRKKSALSAIFEGKVSPLTMRFLTWVTERGREELLSDIVLAFESLYKEDKNITTIYITTAVELDQASIDKIVSKLKQSSQEEQQFEIITTVDPSILGGFVLKYGDNLYDASLENALNEMRKALMDS